MQYTHNELLTKHLFREFIIKFTQFLKISVVCSILLAMFGIEVTQATNTTLCKITIQNISSGQVLSPVAIAIHNDNMKPIFELQKPASPELNNIAQGGEPVDMVEKFMASPDVLDSGVLLGENPESFFPSMGPIAPGASGSITLDCGGSYRYLSFASMLASTNDGFVGVPGYHIPTEGKAVFYVRGYDAGSEENTESCTDIPQPFCPDFNFAGPPNPGDDGNPQPEKEPPYVHIHDGVHGIKDLKPYIV